MWYIFKDNVCIGDCSSEPNRDDLESRGEIAIESNEVFPIDQVIKDAESKKIMQKPMPELTVEELKAQKLSALDIEYQSQFAELSQSLGTATLADNTNSIASIKADYTTLKTEYDVKRGEISGS